MECWFITQLHGSNLGMVDPLVYKKVYILGAHALQVTTVVNMPDEVPVLQK